MKIKVTHLTEITIFILLMLIIIVPGCGQKTDGNTQNPLTTQPPTIKKTINNNPCNCGNSGSGAAMGSSFITGMRGDMVIDHAPKPNESAKLNWCLKGGEDWTELHAWVQFKYDSGKPGDVRYLPMSEVHETMLIDGQVEFLGSLVENEEKSFSATVKFPKEGKWSAMIRFLGKSVIRDATNTSERDLYSPPPFTGPDVKIYVTANSPQLGFPKDWATSGGINIPSIDDNINLITSYVDMEKPPGLNEPVTMTWGFGNIRDLYDVKFYLEFYHIEGNYRKPVPTIDLVIDSQSLTTKDAFTKDATFDAFINDYRDRGLSALRMESSSLREIPANGGAEWMSAKSLRERFIASVPLKFSTVVIFPKEGDWEIRSIGSVYRPDLKRNVGGSGSLFFNVAKSGSTWGWRQCHERECP